MEIKEYLAIIKKDRKMFISIILAIIAVSLAFFYLRKPFYQVSLSLNVTRTGSQNTQEYKYDGYYRLQADEKFVETIVQWLKDPRIMASILDNAGIDSEKKNISELTKTVRSEKLSSQIVSISFSTPDEKTAQLMSGSIIKAVSENAKNLNKDQKEEAWFEVMASQPVIKKYQVNYPLVFIISAVFGVFLGFWVVMIRHYLK
jgi:capsular polysaccharide biosynthesis protein